MEGGMEQEDAKTRRFGDGSEPVIGACIEVRRHLGALDYKSTKLECGHEAVLKNGLSRLVLSPNFASSRLPVNLP
jgi:hypothetical protein